MQNFQNSTPDDADGDRHHAPGGVNSVVAPTYARADIPVFPCDARKRPLTRRGHHDATTDLDAIRRWWSCYPTAMVGIPTGPHSGVWVLDVDGEAGRQSVNGLLARLGAETLADLTPCISLTPSGGLHLIFRLQPGERPRNRARDIGAGLDTRGVKVDGGSAGYFIAPGSTRLDGRRYAMIDATTLLPVELPPAKSLENAAPAPRGLLYLASFNDAQRAVIAASPDLREAIRDSAPAAWSAIFEQHQTAECEASAMASGPQRHAPTTLELERQRRYVATILDRELPALADMQPGSGRNDAAFRLVCRVGRWVHAGIITRDQLIADVLGACQRNGLVHDDGRKAVLDTIASGIARSAHDELPELEARHA